MPSISSLGCSYFGYGTDLGAQSFLATIGSLLFSQCLLTEDWPPEADVYDGEYFDFIIVGAGSAGCVVANRLSEVPQWRILLIEAGPDPPFQSSVPGLMLSLINSKYDWSYYAVNDNKFRTTDPSNVQHWPRGKMLGGTSSLNSMVYMRGSPNDYNRWAAAGNYGWDWPTVLNYFKKSENINDYAVSNNPDLSSFHSKGGLLNVEHNKDANVELSNAVIGAFSEIGFTPLLDLNGPTQLGVARVHTTTVNGRRASAATAFLNPAAKRPNLYVLTETLATKIIINSFEKNAEGVEVIRKSGQKARFYAYKDVIVSSGTVNSPQLLMLSGIGPSDHLRNLGIPVIADLPVGENLHDHYNAPVIVVAEESQPVTNFDNIIEVIKYLAHSSGSLTTTFQPDVNAFFSVTDNQEYPDIQVLPNLFPMDYKPLAMMCEQYSSISMCDALKVLNKNHKLFIFFAGLVNVKSKGRIMLQSDNPQDPAIIKPNSLSNPEDLDRLVKGCIKISEIVNTTMFKSVGAKLGNLNISICADLEAGSIEFWRCIIYNLGTSQWHPTGSVKMGPLEDVTSVVSNRLKVHGVNNLRIVDCSIMPTQPVGNTNAPAMMIGERASDFIKEDYFVI